MGKESMKSFLHVTYNGLEDSLFGVHIARRPSIPSAREVMQTYQIPGRDGQLVIKDGTIEDINISVDFSFTAYPDVWQATVNSLKNWLTMTSGASLEFSDITDAFYRVRYVELSDFKREYKKIGTFTATFTCEGCQYLDSGQEASLQPSSLSNPGIVSHPQYQITASSSGTCTLTVNGKSLQATVASNMTIDTDRAIAYRTTDGVALNTSLIMGSYDFKDFWLKPGSNSISITSGYTLRVIPNWRRL